MAILFQKILEAKLRKAIKEGLLPHVELLSGSFRFTEGWTDTEIELVAQLSFEARSEVRAIQEN